MTGIAGSGVIAIPADPRMMIGCVRRVVRMAIDTTKGRGRPGSMTFRTGQIVIPG